MTFGYDEDDDDDDEYDYHAGDRCCTDSLFAEECGCPMCPVHGDELRMRR